MVEGKIMNGNKYGTVKGKEGKENIGLQFRREPVDRDTHTYSLHVFALSKLDLHG